MTTLHNEAGSTSATEAAAPIRIRARTQGEVTEARVLMPHPMESGFRKNEAGGTLRAHYITSVQVSVEGRPVLEATMSPAVSKDPLLYFRFRHAKPGERIRVTWIDNRGARRVDEALIS